MENKKNKEGRNYKMKQKERKKLNNKGITLIALVITIIVLLILAGVSIAMLTGENGILTQAQNAKKETSIAEEKEQIALAYNAAIAKKQSTDITAKELDDELKANDAGADATKDGENIKVTFEESKREYIIDENGTITGPTESNIVATIKIEGEKLEGEPPMPAGFTHVAGTTVDNGYVIQDGDENQYVWVPVDKDQKIKVNVTSKEEITSITLTDPYGDTATLAERNIGTTYTNNEIEPTINGPYVLKVSTATDEKEVEIDVNSLYATRMWELDMLTDEVAKVKGYADLTDFCKEYFKTSGDLEETKNMIKQTYKSGMLTETEEYDTKTSVNTNGGFYIGRYEASYEDGKPASKVSTIANTNSGTENGKLWNNISQTNALTVAKGMYENVDFTSTLLTGAAWDRTLGWLEETGAVSSLKIVGDSKTWGNYSDDTFSETNGLIKTGSKTETEKNHIFDLAGNVWEWTTEAHSTDNRVIRGGSYLDTGSNGPVSYRNNGGPAIPGSGIGFRLALFL